MIQLYHDFIFAQDLMVIKLQKIVTFTFKRSYLLNVKGSR